MYFKYTKRRNKIPIVNTFTTKKEYFTPEICNTSHIKLDNKTCIKKPIPNHTFKKTFGKLGKYLY